MAKGDKPRTSPVETLRAMHAEAQADISRRLQGLSDLDGKANQVMGLSATVLAVVLAGLSIVADKTTPASFFSGASWVPWTGIGILSAGILALLVAIFWSIAAYLRKDVPVGISGDDLLSVLDRGADEPNYLSAAIAAYAEGIRSLEKENLTTAGQLRLTIGFFLAGLVLVSAGVGILMGRILAVWGSHGRREEAPARIGWKRASLLHGYNDQERGSRAPSTPAPTGVMQIPVRASAGQSTVSMAPRGRSSLTEKDELSDGARPVKFHVVVERRNGFALD